MEPVPRGDMDPKTHEGRAKFIFQSSGVVGLFAGFKENFTTYSISPSLSLLTPHSFLTVQV